MTVQIDTSKISIGNQDIIHTEVLKYLSEYRRPLVEAKDRNFHFEVVPTGIINGILCFTVQNFAVRGTTKMIIGIANLSLGPEGIYFFERIAKNIARLSKH